MAFEQLKMLGELKKAQKALANEIIEVETGDGAVVVQVNGELKIKKIELDKDKIDFDDMRELERWLEKAIAEAYTRAQQIAQEKMTPLMGKLGLGNG
ncbi:YbaB/EbfC family nucleoid-associated protein [Candidatus Saccharibacteria bacterium]|nr:YbaB/EbfC family nucleoid-associated protein [Candidatus Saccharibacteria bacterium]